MRFSEIKRITNLRCCEDELYSMGYENIAGVDEVGRGSLAGPLVAAAVILDRDNLMLEGIKDSKKLTARTRQKLFNKIIKSCKCWSIAKISPAEIDRENITELNVKAFDIAISRLKIKPGIAISDFINIDSKRLSSISKTGFIPITGGDNSSISIAAASILAKVTRDRLMKRLANTYPLYGFDKNKGYGTKKHLISLKKYGPTIIHRTSFKGVLQ
jgi:ribonuclease HII